jgi:hypothetical protein
MAERFGGKYSPNGQGSEPTTPPILVKSSPEMGRSGVLFFLAVLQGINAFRGGPQALILGLAACGVMVLGAWLTREGVRAQDAYDARKVAKRPAFPRKIAGALCFGAALVLSGLNSQAGPLYPLLFGLAGVILHLGAFGPDPRADKGMAGIDGFQVERVSRAVDEGEAYLAAMKDAILRAKDRALEARVDKFAGLARGLFRTVENDPGDLTAARKFLTVYLMGARDATVKFADAYAASRKPETRADYEALLTDLETTFAARTQALLANDHTDLDVEIQVLRERLYLEK